MLCLCFGKSEAKELNYPNGDSYDGDVIDGKPDGNGIMKCSNGWSYEGEWKNGKPFGRGQLEVVNFTSSDRYENSDGQMGSSPRSVIYNSVPKQLRVDTRRMVLRGVWNENGFNGNLSSENGHNGKIQNDLLYDATSNGSLTFSNLISSVCRYVGTWENGIFSGNLLLNGLHAISGKGVEIKNGQVIQVWVDRENKYSGETDEFFEPRGKGALSGSNLSLSGVWNKKRLVNGDGYYTIDGKKYLASFANEKSEIKDEAGNYICGYKTDFPIDVIDSLKLSTRKEQERQRQIQLAKQKREQDSIHAIQIEIARQKLEKAVAQFNDNNAGDTYFAANIDVGEAGFILALAQGTIDMEVQLLPDGFISEKSTVKTRSRDMMTRMMVAEANGGAHIYELVLTDVKGKYGIKGQEGTFITISPDKTTLTYTYKSGATQKLTKKSGLRAVNRLVGAGSNVRLMQGVYSGPFIIESKGKYGKSAGSVSAKGVIRILPNNRYVREMHFGINNAALDAMAPDKVKTRTDKGRYEIKNSKLYLITEDNRREELSIIRKGAALYFKDPNGIRGILKLQQ